MSKEEIARILKNRREFTKHLKEDVTKNDQILKNVNEELDNLKITSENVKKLGEKVEHPGLLPVGKRIYVNGNIIHTGEYFLDKIAFPESYSTVETLNDTMKLLQRKIKIQSELLKKSENAKEQLEERINLIEGDGTTNDDFPQEIISEKGVAVKVGDFYEILEFEN